MAKILPALAGAPVAAAVPVVGSAIAKVCNSIVHKGDVAKRI